MNTLTINSKAHEVLARATERAKVAKPLVRKTAEYGKYKVRSTTNQNHWYTVTCNSETKSITCNCKSVKPCLHIAAVAPVHVHIARQKRDEAAKALATAEAEAAGWPLPVEQSEVPSFDAEAAPVAAPADFTDQVQEIRQICTATAAQLATYTAEMAERDRSDLFG